jgi:hypothetical protein
VWNNPLRYTDPSGEELATLTTPEQRGYGGSYGSSDANLSATGSFFSSGNSTATAGSARASSSAWENTKAFVSSPTTKTTTSLLDSLEPGLARGRDNLVAAIPFAGPDLYKQGVGSYLKAVDPYQGAVDTVRQTINGQYLAATVAAAGVIIKPLRAVPADEAMAAVLSNKATPTVVVAGKEGAVIIGETMARVEAAAAKIPGAKILNDMPDFKAMGMNAVEQTSAMMQYNRVWILDQLRSGRQIIDIGLDPNRGIPSIFYQMEQNMMKNYDKLKSLAR